MKRLLLAFAFLLAAGTAGAAVETAITDENLLWTIDGGTARPSLMLTLRIGDQEPQTVVVPTTEDPALDAQPRLAWDAKSRTLFVLWRREGANGDEIRLARRYASGRWAPPITVARGTAAARAGLQLVITHSQDKDAATLVHAAWWSLAQRPVAEYALIAFQGAEFLSVSVDSLDELAALLAAAGDDEDTGKAAHPPLAMVRSGQGVEVAYGAPRTTAVTRLQLEPKVAPNARIWRPSGKDGRRTPAAHFISANSSPVESFIVGSNVVLYTPDARFRYVVLEDGKWTPVRMFATDDKLTSDDLLRELRRSVGQHGAVPSAPDAK
ncbi:MAG TPA: hypothetical protein VND45_04830 [Thermoanaerobaculia bacterium]|nr:hypothetical protein [Thermoanaerobaculia bacterium]